MAVKVEQAPSQDYSSCFSQLLFPLQFAGLSQAPPFRGVLTGEFPSGCMQMEVCRLHWASMERAIMPTIRQRIASTFVVLYGRYGDVTKMAQNQDLPRQSLNAPRDRLGHAPTTGTDRGNEGPGVSWPVKSWPRILNWDRGFSLARAFPYPRLPI